MCTSVLGGILYATVRLKEKTKNSLEFLKENKRESFDTLVNKLITLVPKGDEEGEYTNTFRASLLQGLYEVKSGETISHADLKKELGL